MYNIKEQDERLEVLLETANFKQNELIANQVPVHFKNLQQHFYDGFVLFVFVFWGVSCSGFFNCLFVFVCLFLAFWGGVCLFVCVLVIIMFLFICF